MHLHHLPKKTVMIELLNRQQILQLNKTFAAFIGYWQDAQYNPLRDDNKYTAGEMYENADDEKPRYFSQEECDQLNEERLEEYNKLKDDIKTISLEDKYQGQLIYNFPAAPINSYVKNLSEGIVTLATELKWGSVIFLLDFAIPWFYQNNDYPPVKNALAYLKKIGVDDEFTGGFKADGHDLAELVKNLFWLIRCNAALPYCWFSGINKDFVGDICKYGNIHFRVYADRQKTEIQDKAGKMNLIEIDECYENFSETGAIEGRQTIF